MAYELGPDGFIRRTGRGATYTPASRPTGGGGGGGGGSSGAGIAVFFIIVVIVVLIVVGINSTKTTQTNVTPTQPQAPVVNTSWPADSPDLSPTGYIQSINARVDSFKFFEAGEITPAKDDRVYTSSFQQEDGKFIYWELSLVHPTRQFRQTFSTAIYVYRPDGTVKSQLQSSSYIEPAWANSFHFNRWTEPLTTWAAGDYRVSFFADGVKVASGNFTIQAQPEQTPVATEPPTETTAPPEETQPPAYNPPREPEAPKLTVAEWRRQLEASCAIERRLRSLPAPGPDDLEQLQRVKGACERLYGTNAFPTDQQPVPTPSPTQGWRRFGDNRPPEGQHQDSVVEEAQLIGRVQPSYPPLAKQARVQGTVRISATIGIDGKLRNIRVISGHPLLSGAAVSAVSQWRYSPARLHGNPIQVDTTIDVNFNLGQ